jgi:hypothetical protein
MPWDGSSDSSRPTYWSLVKALILAMSTIPTIGSIRRTAVAKSAPKPRASPSTRSPRRPREGRLLMHEWSRRYGHAYDDLRGGEAASVVHLADEMLDHFLRHLEIGDDAVAQRPDRVNVAWGAADHQFRLLSDGEDLPLAPDARDCDHRRLVQNDTAPFHVDDGVCRTEVDRHVGRQQTQHSSKQHRARPQSRYAF